jgi:serine/threonine protein kinase
MGETIGEGSFGLVKIGYNKITNVRVAIKILEKEQIQNKEDWDLIETEIDILKLCKHPSIIGFYDQFENSEYIFIVMEYLNSGDLETFLQKKKFKLSENIIKSIAYQIADGLRYLHSFGIIHRDIKPQNIMIASKNTFFDSSSKIEIKITDFGLSKFLGFREKAFDGVGTLAYIAPEILLKKPYQSSVDIWSFGVMVYYMISGEFPFKNITTYKETSVQEILKTQISFSNKFNNKNLEVINLIKQCLEKINTKRISTNDLINHKWFKTDESKNECNK